jgi:hypothetical protein
MDRQPGQVGLDMSAWTGLKRQDDQNRTARTGQNRLDKEERTVRIRRQGQVNWDMTTGQDTHRIARTGPSGRDSKNMTAGTGLLKHDSQKRST